MISRFLYWLPRILTILAILFMAMFSVDVFQMNEPFGRKLLGFLMHNIPALILIVFLVIAWKYELPGGVLFIIAFIASGIFFGSFSGNTGSLVVILPFLISGVLFILHDILYNRKKKNGA